MTRHKFEFTIYVRNGDVYTYRTVCAVHNALPGEPTPLSVAQGIALWGQTVIRDGASLFLSPQSIDAVRYETAA